MEWKTDEFLLFLKAFSWETDLWVTLGGFTTKAKFGRDIRIKLTTDNIKTKCDVWQIITMKHLAVICKISNVTKLPRISHIHKNRIHIGMIGDWWTNYFFPINLMIVAWQESIHFFIFSSCEPLFILLVITSMQICVILWLV